MSDKPSPLALAPSPPSSSSSPSSSAELPSSSEDAVAEVWLPVLPVPSDRPATLAPAWPGVRAEPPTEASEAPAPKTGTGGRRFCGEGPGDECDCAGDAAAGPSRLWSSLAESSALLPLSLSLLAAALFLEPALWRSAGLPPSLSPRMQPTKSSTVRRALFVNFVKTAGTPVELIKSLADERRTEAPSPSQAESAAASVTLPLCAFWVVTISAVRQGRSGSRKAKRVSVFPASDDGMANPHKRSLTAFVTFGTFKALASSLSLRTTKLRRILISTSLKFWANSSAMFFGMTPLTRFLASSTFFL
mmetsp:Transcript_1607/g.4784  ORF Transcript_1607/g.4784 Transcript_1607/m.4784 type:complete len:304 (+) Transcript_1607:331-1242(+)